MSIMSESGRLIRVQGVADRKSGKVYSNPYTPEDGILFDQYFNGYYGRHFEHIPFGYNVTNKKELTNVYNV